MPIYKTHIKPGHPALKDWLTLTQFIQTADEKTCLQLMAVEKKGRARHTMLMRIFSRYNHLRGQRERKELVS